MTNKQVSVEVNPTQDMTQVNGVAFSLWTNGKWRFRNRPRTSLAPHQQLHSSQRLSFLKLPQISGRQSLHNFLSSTSGSVNPWGDMRPDWPSITNLPHHWRQLSTPVRYNIFMCKSLFIRMPIRGVKAAFTLLFETLPQHLRSVKLYIKVTFQLVNRTLVLSYSHPSDD